MIHLPPSKASPLSPLPLLSLLGVTSLSVPKPALTKALTSVDARFWRALSTAGPCGWRPSGGRGRGDKGGQWG